MIKAVFFDLFETLITEWENGSTVAFGTPDSVSPAPFLGISEDLFKQEWVARRPRRMNGYFNDYYTVLKDICDTLNLDVDDKILRSLNQKRLSAKLQLYRKIEPNVLKMLDDLKRRGIKIGLISNCSSEEVHGLFNSALVSFIDEIVLSCQVKCSKPHKEIYMLACDKLKVDPSESIFIGDGGANELSGAANAGMAAYRATWFINRGTNGDEFPQIAEPMHVLDLIED